MLLAQSAPFPFLKLPSELRNTVYKMLLVSDKPLRVTRGKPGPKRYCGNHGAALLRVNRQIHDEAGSILYGCNEFIFHSSTAVHDFFDRVSPTRKLVTKVNIQNYFLSSHNNMFNALVKYPQIAEINFIGDIKYSYDQDRLARTIVCNARQFLTAVSNSKKTKLAGLDILSFRAATLHTNATALGSAWRKYTRIEYEAFMDAIRARTERLINNQGREGTVKRRRIVKG